MTSKKKSPRKYESGTLHEALPQIRLGIRAGDYRVGTLSLEDSPWYESPEEVDAGLKLSEETHAQAQALLDLMRECLTSSEFTAMQLHYLYSMPYRQVGLIMDRNASTVYRYVQRALKKIRLHLNLPET